MRILLVEDDRMIGNSVQRGLQINGMAVDWVQDGHLAELALSNDAFDLLILDLGLPKKGGLEVLSTLRRRGDKIPILILTARDTVEERVKGLDSGADDYLVKPFNLSELAARVRALSRRKAGRAEALIEHDGITLNPATHEATFNGEHLLLSGREYALLEALLERPGAVLSRAQLLDKLYGWDDEVESNTVEVYIHALRRKFGADFIKNVRGVGYMVPKKKR